MTSFSGTSTLCSSWWYQDLNPAFVLYSANPQSNVPGSTMACLVVPQTLGANLNRMPSNLFLIRLTLTLQIKQAHVPSITDLQHAKANIYLMHLLWMSWNCMHSKVLREGILVLERLFALQKFQLAFTSAGHATGMIHYTRSGSLCMVLLTMVLENGLMHGSYLAIGLKLLLGIFFSAVLKNMVVHVSVFLPCSNFNAHGMRHQEFHYNLWRTADQRPHWHMVFRTLFGKWYSSYTICLLVADEWKGKYFILNFICKNFWHTSTYEVCTTLLLSDHGFACAWTGVIMLSSHLRRVRMTVGIIQMT